MIDIGIKDEHGATTEYFLTLLSTIMPDHVIFSKGYMPSAEHSKYTRQTRKREICYDNSDGFFDGLPLHLKESKAFAGHKPRVPMKKRIVIADSDSDMYIFFHINKYVLKKNPHDCEGFFMLYKTVRLIQPKTSITTVQIYAQFLYTSKYQGYKMLTKNC